MRHWTDIPFTRVLAGAAMMGPILMIFGMLLMAPYFARLVYPPPDSFAIDSAERVYLARSDGVHVYENQQEIARYPMRDAAALITISPDDILRIATSKSFLDIDLSQSDLASSDFVVLHEEVTDRMISVFDFRDARKGFTRNGIDYRYETRFLRYRIIAETGESYRVLYEMTARDYRHRLLRIGWMACFWLIFPIVGLWGFLYWKKTGRVPYVRPQVDYRKLFSIPPRKGTK